MRPGTVPRVVIAGWLLMGCMRARDFDARLATLDAAAGADAEAAHRCAGDLGALAIRDPIAAGSSLELQDSPTGVLTLPPLSVAARPRWAVARRARDEIARRERAIEGSRKAIAAARTVGPAALDLALDAGGRARAARERLCRARDVASAIASAREPRPEREEMTSWVR